jgi:hypothetical protein
MGKESSRREFLARGAVVVVAGFAPVGVTSLAAQTVGGSRPTSQGRDVGHPDLGRGLVVPQPMRFGDVNVGGELGRRMGQNFGRLQSDIYRPGALWRQTNWKSWPGDFEGRALLADTLLARATGEIPAYYDAMAGAYPKQLNEHGYFGPSLDGHAINEQQLSGHGWYLRALCEVYTYQRANAGAVQSVRPEQTLAMIRAIVRNLALPLRGKYAVYPIDPAIRASAVAPTSPGAVDGHLSGQHGDWTVSSDTGCAFIFLDGLAHAWVVLKGAGAPEAAGLKALIDEAVVRFAAMDLVAVKAQTHASLTAMRALLRLYAVTGDAALLGAAWERFRIYRATAMTATYANTNWFGRPETWTEPCAVIDSFMVATQLWQQTGKASFLEDAHKIWYNGVGRGQRGNGGFGTDTCAGFGTPWTRVRSYEAYFCCTMRGAEGFARAAQYLYFTRPGELTVPFFSDSNATVDVGHGEMKLAQKTEYPYDGKVRIDVVWAGRAAPMTLRLLSPGWVSGQRLTINGAPVSTTVADGFLVAKIAPKIGDVLVLDQQLKVGAVEPVSAVGLPGYFAMAAGPMMLGYNPAIQPADLRSPDPAEMHVARGARLEPAMAGGSWRVAGTNVVLGRINDLNDSNAGPKEACARQVLFRG